MASTRLILLGITAGFVLTGCGRKATESDCQLIIDRNVAVKLKDMNITDPAVVAKKQEEFRTQFKGETQDCVGRRVSDGMMACVKKAQTSDEITQCMR